MILLEQAIRKRSNENGVSNVDSTSTFEVGVVGGVVEYVEWVAWVGWLECGLVGVWSCWCGRGTERMVDWVGRQRGVDGVCPATCGAALPSCPCRRAESGCERAVGSVPKF